jgi:hypothetical protein
LLNGPVASISAPGGRIDDRVAGAALASGYQLTCSSTTAVLTRPGLLREIPRFPVRASTSPAQFAALVAGDAALLQGMARRARLLEAAKALLGNRIYEKVRGIVVR